MPEYIVSDCDGLWGSVRADSQDDVHAFLADEIWPNGLLDPDYSLSRCEESECLPTA